MPTQTMCYLRNPSSSYSMTNVLCLRSPQSRYYLGQTSCVWTSSILPSLFLQYLTLIGKEEVPCSESIPAFQMGDLSSWVWTSPCMLLRDKDAHSCVVPDSHLYLNMGNMCKAICGLPINSRLVSREKSPQGEECCNSAAHRLVACTVRTREACSISHGYQLRLPLLCNHVGTGTRRRPQTHIEADANATCSYEELMNMLRFCFKFFSRNVGIGAREHARNAGNIMQNLQTLSSPPRSRCNGYSQALTARGLLWGCLLCLQHTCNDTGLQSQKAKLQNLFPIVVNPGNDCQ